MNKPAIAPPKKCEDCGQMIKNKEYLKHRVETHKDSKAKALLEELEEL